MCLITLLNRFGIFCTTLRSTPDLISPILLINDVAAQFTSKLEWYALSDLLHPTNFQLDLCRATVLEFESVLGNYKGAILALYEPYVSVIVLIKMKTV